LKYPGGYQLPAEQVHPVPGLGLVQVDVEPLLVPAISGGIQSPFLHTQPATGAVPGQEPAISGGIQSPFLQTHPTTGAVPGHDVLVVGGFQVPFTHVHPAPGEVLPQAISGGIQLPFLQTQPATGAVPGHVLISEERGVGNESAGQWTSGWGQSH
jgi:hypothetical protein